MSFRIIENSSISRLLNNIKEYWSQETVINLFYEILILKFFVPSNIYLKK